MSKNLKQKGRKILRAQNNRHYPEWDILQYNLSLIKNLNFYSLEVDDKDKMKYAIAYWKSLDLPVKGLEKLRPSWFSTVGAVCHMIHKRELPISDSDIARVMFARIQLINEAKLIIEEKSTKEVVTVQDRMNEIAASHIGEIEGQLDDFVLNKTEIDVKAYIKANAIKAPVAKKIADHFKKQIPELQEAIVGGDSQLKEGYSNFSKAGLRKYTQVVEKLVEDCGHAIVIARTTCAPRIRKAQPASKLVAKIKYLKDFADMNMKSQHPEKIIGAQETWWYDTAKRRIIRYVAQDGMELGVRGTTILNFAPDKSCSKIVRKPEILNGHADLTKRPMNSIMNDIRATAGKVTGRTNPSMILLKCF